VSETYTIVRGRDPVAIICLLCHAVSYNLNDVERHYCGACHLFHDVVEQCRRDVANGASHDCGEWRTARGLCALCGAEV
jgi:hypothetical protein